MDKLVIVRLTGGLGNQLFQYAVAKMLSLKTNVPMKIDQSSFIGYKLHEYGMSAFNIQENFASEEECLQLKNPRKTAVEKLIKKLFLKTKDDKRFIFEESNFSYDQRLFNVKPPVYLDGYWQSEKYFLEIEKEIRREFEIIIPPSIENKEILQDIQKNNSISIHIRRGDYVTVPKFKEFHGTCSLDYYNNAISYIKQRVENPVFYIFSNDIPWSKEHLIIDGNVIFVDINDAKTNYEDLRLMKNCKHNIIANSTFSWWGAWLNDNACKIIIAPQKWFENKEMQAQIQDLTPENWIKI